MNDEVLQLREESLNEYTSSLCSNYQSRKKELEIIITNMPQKHSFANHVSIELEKMNEEILQAEIEILKRSSRNYVLLTNALLYLERRWNTEVVVEIISRSFSQEIREKVISLIIDSEEAPVDKKCAVQPFSLSTSEFPGELEDILRVIQALREPRVVSSARDVFTSYKVLLAYGQHAHLAVEELLALSRLEGFEIKNIVGAIFLGVVLKRKEVLSYSSFLVQYCKKEKSALSYAAHALLQIYNRKLSIWNELQDVVPHLYTGLEKDQGLTCSLLYTLNLKNAVFLYETTNGKVPEMEVFDLCKRGRHSLPHPDIRSAVQSLLTIPAEETYPTDTSVQIGTVGSECAANFKPTVEYSKIDKIEAFFQFFFTKASLSFTHFNNTLLEYRHVFNMLKKEEVGMFVHSILSSANSLVFKELAVHRTYQLLKKRHF